MLESTKVDNDKFTLSDVAIITEGPALGHDMFVDSTMLAQVVEGINATPKGVKSRLTHPGLAQCGGKDGIEVTLGRVSNARIEGNQVKGDVKLGRFASVTPQGDLRTYLMAIAEEDPELIGLSIVFEPDEMDSRFATDENGNPVLDDDGEPVVEKLARVKRMLAADFVGDPAANAGGLLSRLPETVTKGLTADLIADWLASDQLAEQSQTSVLPNKENVPDKLSSTGPESEMPEQNEKPKADTSETVDLAAVKAEAAEEARKAELSRIREIKALCESHGLTELGEELSADGDVTLEIAKDKVLETLANAEQKSPVSVHVGEDANKATFAAAVSDAIRLRAGAPVEKAHERSAQFQHKSLLEMGRDYLRTIGVKNADSLSREKVASYMLSGARLRQDYAVAFAGGGQAVGSFDNILEDTIGKSLRSAYLDKPAAWQAFARRATAPDYKTISRTALSESPDLASWTNGGEIKHVQLGDQKETYVLADYGNVIDLTRRAIINDDLDAFNRIPVLQGNAARRKEDDVAFAILTANAAMSDTVALFHTASHGNLAGSGGALSVATLGAARAAMRVQKGPKDAAYLNLTPATLIVPTAIETTAEQLISSIVDPTKSNATPNPFSNGLNIVAEARLDANSATAWYLAASPSDIDTIEVCFLEGEQMPRFERKLDFDTESLQMKVAHTVSAKAIDYRGLYKNPGA